MLRYPSIKASQGKSAPTKQRLKDWHHITTNTTGSKSVHNARVVVPWKEFLSIAIILETPLYHILYYVNNAIEYGGLLFLIAYFIFTKLLALPVYVSLVFFGSYTKKGYFKFWDMVPILKGMIWAISLYSILLELFNVELAGLALLYMYDVVNSSLPWANCNFEGAGRKCYIPKNSSDIYNKTCCKLGHACTSSQRGNRIHFPAYNYLVRHQIRTPRNRREYGSYRSIGMLQPRWVFASCFTWFIILLLLIKGFRRFHFMVNNITLVFAAVFSLLSIGTALFMSVQVPRPATLDSFFINILNPRLWIGILTHSFSRKLPGNFISLGSYAPPTINPTENLFGTYCMKILSFTILTIWLSTSISAVQINYRVEDASCIPVSGLVFLFALIPDIFSTFPVPQGFLIFYFLCLWFYGFLSALYTMTFFYESIVEAVPSILPIRIYFCTVLCTACCLLNLALLTNFNILLTLFFNRYVFPFLTISLMLLYCLGLFIYSLHNYAQDYYFTYGKPLGKFWENGLHGTLLFVISALLIFLYLNVSIDNPVFTLPMKMFWYVYTFVILVPVFATAIWIYFKYKNTSQTALCLTPGPLWGPPIYSKRQSRKRFDPSREVRNKKDEQKCKHNCLLLSDKLKNAIQQFEENRGRLIKQLENTYSTSNKNNN